MTAFLIGPIGQGASALRHHIAPTHPHVVVLLDGRTGAAGRN